MTLEKVYINCLGKGMFSLLDLGKGLPKLPWERHVQPVQQLLDILSVKKKGDL